MTHSSKQNQQGALTIEFALLFSLFFIVVYAIIAYSLPLLLRATLNHAAAEAHRAIYELEPYILCTHNNANTASNPTTSSCLYANKVSEQIDKVLKGKHPNHRIWLPSAWNNVLKSCPAPNSLDWSELPNKRGWYQYTLSNGQLRSQVYVCFEYPYKEHPLLPSLKLLGINIPNLKATTFKGSASARHY